MTERLGISLAPDRHIGVDGLIEVVQLAESRGFESVWIPETWGADAVSILSVLARETQTIRLASGVFNVYSRSPMLVAQTAATLQALSHGRFVLGLGASGPLVVENWHGLPYRHPIERSRRYVESIRLALSGAAVDYDGGNLRLRGFRLQNPPHTPVPIYLAALGPKNIALAGEVGDGWLPIFTPCGHMKPMFDALRAGAERAGRALSDVDVAAYIPAASGPRAELLLRQQIAYYVGGMGTFYASMLSRLGFQDDVARVRDAWQEGDRISAVKAVPNSLLELCTIAGSGTESARRLRSYRLEGVSLPILAVPRGSAADEVASLVEGLTPAATMPDTRAP
jgi:F420-dependent oxidoreductase-like protein